MSNARYWTLLLMVAAGCAKAGPGSGWDDIQELDEVGGGGGEAGAPSTSSGSSSSSSSSSGSGGQGGAEAPSCADDQELCGGICMDVMTDPSHCGGCFQSCAVGEDCVAGQCTPDGGTSNAWMCDPIAPLAKCGPDSRCQPRPDGNPVCYSPIGAGNQYDACSTASQCDAIHECLQIGTNKFCVQWCLTSADCPNAGDQCHQLGQPIYVGSQAWGICWDGVV